MVLIPDRSLRPHLLIVLRVTGYKSTVLIDESVLATDGRTNRHPHLSKSVPLDRFNKYTLILVCKYVKASQTVRFMSSSLTAGNIEHWSFRVLKSWKRFSRLLTATAGADSDIGDFWSYIMLVELPFVL